LSSEVEGVDAAVKGIDEIQVTIGSRHHNMELSILIQLQQDGALFDARAYAHGEIGQESAIAARPKGMPPSNQRRGKRFSKELQCKDASFIRCHNDIELTVVI